MRNFETKVCVRTRKSSVHFQFEITSVYIFCFSDYYIRKKFRQFSDNNFFKNRERLKRIKSVNPINLKNNQTVLLYSKIFENIIKEIFLAPNILSRKYYKEHILFFYRRFSLYIRKLYISSLKILITYTDYNK